MADISMIAYLPYPADETGYDLAVSHPAVSAWLGRVAGSARLAIGLRSVARQAHDALRVASRAKSVTGSSGCGSTPSRRRRGAMMTATAIAHPLTRTALMVCRFASFCAISRLRALVLSSASFTASPPDGQDRLASAVYASLPPSSTDADRLPACRQRPRRPPAGREPAQGRTPPAPRTGRRPRPP